MEGNTELAELQMVQRAVQLDQHEEKQFLGGLIADLDRFQDALGGKHKPSSLLQLVGAPAQHGEKPTANLAAAVKKQPKKDFDINSVVTQMNQMGVNQMAPMASLIRSMYDEWKAKIGEANKKEKEQKKNFDQNIRELEEKKKAAHGDKGSVATYDMMENYWKKQRALAHRQYHTSLKIMHSGMEKFKSVSNALQDASEGKKPSASDLRTLGVEPEVVLLQTSVRDLAVWSQSAGRTLRGAMALHSE